ncbi:hypothetical protein UFOVP703_7 [uncultured Caudovirales phage]|uniref:Uncharacterized protein n=1 Tax=uncultured Caudovirales phage TaxID=2100421 RepID=A0A6J5NF73_9CAUD|nr:hypothetical protein UFOVP703_7 [uncultured Caudovirales phage]
MQSPELKALIDACSQPRTMEQLRAVLNDMNLEQRVYNAVSRGLLRNVRKGGPRGEPGLFQRVEAAPAKPTAAPPSALRQPRFTDRGRALQSVWGSR